jgi:hypothetical protein
MTTLSQAQNFIDSTDEWAIFGLDCEYSEDTGIFTCKDGSQFKSVEDKGEVAAKYEVIR